MDIKNIIQNLRDFVETQAASEKTVVVYNIQESFSNFFKASGIKVELEDLKEIILQEETELELGGVNKKSFSLIYPIYQLNLINNGKITLIGPEIEYITESSVDFGIKVTDIEGATFFIPSWALWGQMKAILGKIGNKTGAGVKFQIEHLNNGLLKENKDKQCWRLSTVVDNMWCTIDQESKKWVKVSDYQQS